MTSDYKDQKPKLVFFGNERLSSGYLTEAPVLQALIGAGYEICAVVANAAAHGPAQSRNARQLEVGRIAAVHGVPLLTPARPKDILEQLAVFGAAAGVLVAYGRIVPQPVIDIFPRGIINIHPSLLPLHRGPVPVESVILEGAAETGVSLMSLTKAMDAGPLYRQTRIKLNGTETKAGLTTRLLELGRDALLDCLPSILDGSLQPVAQDDSLATYDQLLRPEDGRLDFSEPAVRLEREIRAYADWPKSRASLAGKDVIITAAHVGHEAEEQPTTNRLAGNIFVTAGKLIGIACGGADGSDTLVIDRLKPAGKAEMTAQAFLAGNRL